MKKVVIGMSGGVDSSVSAYLLKEQGYEVIGVTLNQHLEENSKDIEDAKKVCDKLGIVHEVVNIRKDFENIVIKYFLDGYSSGKTPSPCVICDDEIKFKILFDMADKGTVLPISSLCTVFAESEVINYIGEGQKREDIAAGVVDSVANKVAQLAMKKNLPDKVILTGGLSNSTYFTKILSQKLGQTVSPTEQGRYAGALGAALLAKEKKKR